MDGHIQEHTSGNFYIVNAGRLRIAGSDLDDLRFADFACCDSLLNSLKVMVKSSVKSYLVFQVGSFQSFDHFFDLIYIMVNWVFTENMFSSFDCLQGDWRMCVCGGTDQHSVNFRVIDDLFVIFCCVLHTHTLSPCCCLII